MIKQKLPTKKRLMEIATAAGFNRIDELYLSVGGGRALSWSILRDVAQRLPPDGLAVPVEIPRQRQRWVAKGGGSYEAHYEEDGECLLPCVDFRYKNGHVLLLARDTKDFEAVCEGIRWCVGLKGVEILVPWKLVLQKNRLTTC